MYFLLEFSVLLWYFYRANKHYSMKKVITFGEILLRLSTERHLRFSQATNFNATYGGGEFNVAVSLANYGFDTEFVTRLPKNDIGDCALQEIRKYNVSYLPTYRLAVTAWAFIFWKLVLVPGQ